ncbi:ROK family protein [Amycolatopsis sp. WQ 127309]|uniref:ROK family protein n=1 Tax=Amycolatopsis sp. WQ 127309 TaxID=2932773 RepID=UPI001FF26DA4|nr:ROK family protein [Amycolatopsis sp. WQ 127309]UOZ06931.1 ROK family protein [Amycolatopsis sp. WQ 127309]
MTRVIADSLPERLVRPAGKARASVGRPRIMLEVNPGYGWVVGVDVCGTEIRVGLFDLNLRQLAKSNRRVAGAFLDPRDTADKVAAVTRDVLRIAENRQVDVIGVGVGISARPESGEADADLGTLLERRIGGIPVSVGDRVENLGRAESWRGPARGVRRAVVVVIESGVQLALVVDGTVDLAGDWGRTTFVHNGRTCRCGAKGCVEAYFGADGILDQYGELDGVEPLHGHNERSRLSGLLAAATWSAPAAELMRETVACLGAGIGSLATLFRPDRIVLGGWAGMALGDRYLHEIERAADGYTVRGTTLVLGRPGAAVLGAATLPVLSLLEQ